MQKGILVPRLSVVAILAFALVETNAMALGLADLPAAVQKTILANSAERTVSDVQRTRKKGEVAYEIKTTAKDGTEWDLTVAESGTLLEMDLPLGGVPAAVQAAINAQIGQGKLAAIEKQVDGGGVTYVAGITDPDHTGRDFTFAENGALVSEEISLTELPPVVQAVVKAQVGDGALGELQKLFDRGKVTYQAEIPSADDSERDFTYAENGTLLSQDVSLADLSPAVQTAIRKWIGQGKLEALEKQFDDGEATYVAGIAAPNKSARDFTFAQDGTLASVEVRLAELTPAVQAAIKAQVGQGTLGEIQDEIDQGQVTYVASITAADGADREFTFAENGALASEQCNLGDLPSAVQAAIKSQAGEGKLGEIQKQLDQAQPTYLVSMTGPDKTKRDFTFAAGGALVSGEVRLSELPPAVQTAVNLRVGQGKLGGIEKQFDGSAASYVADITAPDNTRRNFTFAENGVLASVEVRLAELPATVQTAIATQTGKGKLGGIEKQFDGNAVTYVAEITPPDQPERDYTFAENGVLSSVEVRLAELPAEVQSAINTQVGRGKLGDIQKELDQGRLTYVAAITTEHNPERDFTFTENGALSSVEASLADLPATVQTAIKNEANKGKLGELQKLFDQGQITYQAEIPSPTNRGRDFTYAEDGTLLSQNVSLAELPAEVRTAIGNQIGDVKLQGIEKSFENGEVTYEATVTTANAQQRNYTFAEDGALRSKQASLAELPSALQAGINTQAGGGKLEEVDETFDGNDISYDVTIALPGGQTGNFTVSEEGTLLSREVSLAEVPPPVRRTINRASEGGKVSRIDEIHGPKNTHYEIEGQKDGKPMSFSVGPQGRLRGAND